MNYGFYKSVPYSYEVAIERVTTALKKEGFGILTTIDVRDTLKKKIDVEFDRYIILGACNPPLAHRALSAERNIGLLLPCNVIVHEKDGQTTIGVFDPTIMSQIIDSQVIRDLADEVRQKLTRVLDEV